MRNPHDMTVDELTIAVDFRELMFRQADDMATDLNLDENQRRAALVLREVHAREKARLNAHLREKLTTYEGPLPVPSSLANGWDKILARRARAKGSNQ